MLILTRRIGEKIIIGDDVTISVLELRGNHVKLGFDAPDYVKINRSEIILNKKTPETIKLITKKSKLRI